MIDAFVDELVGLLVALSILIPYFAFVFSAFLITQKIVEVDCPKRVGLVLTAALIIILALTSNLIDTVVPEDQPNVQILFGVTAALFYGIGYFSCRIKKEG